MEVRAGGADFNVIPRGIEEKRGYRLKALPSAITVVAIGQPFGAKAPPSRKINAVVVSADAGLAQAAGTESQT